MMSLRTEEIMKLYHDIIKQNEPCCAALGFFDGVHTGHQRLMRSMYEYAAANALAPCVFTFAESPCAMLGKSESSALQTFCQRIAAIEEISRAEKCFAVDFVKYKDVTPEDFIENILIEELNVKAVFCGFNFHFGKNAGGDPAVLEHLCAKHDVRAFVTERVSADGETVSSTRLRRLIREGKISEANRLLAHPFCIDGAVVHGKENGRTVGIPTINQRLPDGFVVPRFGVYASLVSVGGAKHRAITNVGVRPTVNGSGVTVETHILDKTEGELYGETVKTELLWFERDERKFADLNDLAAQIHRDIAHISELNIYDMYKDGV